MKIKITTFNSENTAVKHGSAALTAVHSRIIKWYLLACPPIDFRPKSTTWWCKYFWRWPKNYRCGICFILIKKWKIAKFWSRDDQKKIHIVFSILIYYTVWYIIHPQEVSEQSNHYFYKSKLMVAASNYLWVLINKLTLLSLRCKSISLFVNTNCYKAQN